MVQRGDGDGGGWVGAKSVLFPLTISPSLECPFWQIKNVTGQSYPKAMKNLLYLGVSEDLLLPTAWLWGKRHPLLKLAPSNPHTSHIRAGIMCTSLCGTLFILRILTSVMAMCAGLQRAGCGL